MLRNLYRIVLARFSVFWGWFLLESAKYGEKSDEKWPKWPKMAIFGPFLGHFLTKYSNFFNFFQVCAVLRRLGRNYHG